jgi:hypothetical protein
MSLRYHRVFLFGLGRIGFTGIEGSFKKGSIDTHLGYLLTDRKFKVVGAWDSQLDSRKNAEKFLKGKVVLTKNYMDLHPDIAVIAVQEEFQIPLITELMSQSSIKAFVCEKPFGRDGKKIQGIKKDLTDKKTSCFVNYPRSNSLMYSKWHKNLINEIDNGCNVRIIIQISDASKSAIWHALHLLVSLHQKIGEIDFMKSNIIANNSAHCIVLQQHNIYVEMNISRILQSPYAEITIHLENQSIWLKDGFSKVFISDNNKFMGWREFPLKSEPEINLLSNSMRHLYSRVDQTLLSGDFDIRDIEVAHLVHKNILKLRTIDKKINI